MDRGSGRLKSWSGGNRGRLFQEEGGQGRRGRTHEVSSYRTKTRARAGRHAPIAKIKFRVEAGLGRAPYGPAYDASGPLPANNGEGFAEAARAKD